MTIKSKC